MDLFQSADTKLQNKLLYPLGSGPEKEDNGNSYINGKAHNSNDPGSHSPGKYKGGLQKDTYGRIRYDHYLIGYESHNKYSGSTCTGNALMTENIHLGKLSACSRWGKVTEEDTYHIVDETLFQSIVFIILP